MELCLVILRYEVINFPHCLISDLETPVANPYPGASTNRIFLSQICKSKGVLDPSSQNKSYFVFPGLLLTAAMDLCIRLFKSELLPTLLLPKKMNYLHYRGKGRIVFKVFKFAIAKTCLYFNILREHEDSSLECKNGNSFSG